MTKRFVVDIESETIKNTDFRRVLYTTKNMQLVLMSLLPEEEVGEEVHTLDQFIRVEQGEATLFLDSKESLLPDGHAVIIPAGVRHNVINKGAEPLQFYTIYAPPDHKDGIVAVTKGDASKDEPFDGETTE